MARATGTTPPELELPDMPPGMSTIWWAFLQLHAARASGGMGPCAISMSDVLAWQTLNGVELTPFEVDTLQALDGVAIRALAPKQTQPKAEK